MESFYLSISSSLDKRVISFVKKYITITDDEIGIIVQSRQIFLFHDGSPWTKKDDNKDFDIPMGCFDGAECYESVDAYILNLQGECIDKNGVLLHTDDGLGIFENLSGRPIER